MSSPCLDDHQFKKEELESVGELSQVCSRIVLKCLCLARKLVDQIFCGLSTNLQETFITQVTSDNIVMWATLLTIVDWNLCQDSDFAGDLEDSKSTSGRGRCVCVWERGGRLCASSEAERLSLSVGCARSKH